MANGFAIEQKLRRCAEALEHMTNLALEQHSALAQLGDGLLSHLPIDPDLPAKLGHESTDAQYVLRNPMVLRLPDDVLDTIVDAKGWA